MEMNRFKERYERAVKRITEEQSDFDNWFKDSKVVDEQGNPLVVYHGTRSEDFDTFKYSPRRQTGQDFGKAYYFTSSEDVAEGYGYDPSKDKRLQNLDKKRDKVKKRLLDRSSKGLDYSEERDEFLKLGVERFDILQNGSAKDTGGRVIKVYLSMQNPLEVDSDGRYYYIDYPYYFSRAREEHRDGIIVHNVIDSANQGERRCEPCTVYIVFSPNQIKSAERNNGKYSLDSDNIYEKKTPS